MEETPNLNGRRARCCYYNMRSPGHGSNYGTRPGEVCRVEVDSSMDLPFFEYKEGSEFDLFYCGCRGWD